MQPLFVCRDRALRSLVVAWGGSAGWRSQSAADTEVAATGGSRWPWLLGLLIIAGTARAQAPVPLPGPDRTVCSGRATALGVSVPTAGYTYSWSPATGLSNPNIHNPSATITTVPGGAVVTQTYYLTVTSASGSATDSVRVTVLPVPVVGAGADQTICSGQTITLGIPPLPGYTYQWTVDPFLSNPTVAQPTYTPINPTAVSFFRDLVVIVHGPNGCDNTARVRITVEPAIPDAAGPDRAVCAGVATTLGLPATPGYTYRWTPAAGLSNPNIAQPTLTPANPGTTPVTTTYTVRVSNGGCTDSSQAVVTVYPALVADAGAPVRVCAGQPTTLAAGVVPGAATTYRWAPTTGLSNPNVLNPTLTLATPGTFTYLLTATTTPATGATCTASATVVVTVDSLPVAQAAPLPGGSVVLCARETGQLGGLPAAPGATYRWRPTAGLTAPTAATTAISLPNLTTSPITTTYTLVVTSAAGCIDSSQVAVTVNPVVVVEAGPGATVCSGEQATLGAPAQAGYDYQWTPATGLNDATAAQPVLTAVNTSLVPLTLTYYLTATEHRAVSDCSGRDSVQITVNPRPLAQASSAGPGAPLYACTGVALTLGGAGPAPGVTYRWSPAAGLDLPTSAQPHLLLTNSTTTPLSVTYQLTATSAAGCADSSRVTVVVNPAVVADAGADVSVCPGEQITLGAPARPAHRYRWLPATGLSSDTVAQPVFTGVNPTAAALATTYRLEATATGTGAACSASDDVTITISPAPLVAVISGPTTVRDFSQPLSFSVPAAGTTSTYQWSATGGAILAGQGTAQVTVRFAPGAGAYSVSVAELSAAGCAAPVARLELAIDVPVQVYNIITPNNDGRNDAFVIDNIGLYAGSTLRIFNRWGREVFQADNYQNDWGGNEEAPGLYYYLLQLPNAPALKGWVEVVK